MTYLVDPEPATLPLGGQRVRFFESDDGRVEIRHGEQLLPYSVFDKTPHVVQGAIVENKRRGAGGSAIRSPEAGHWHGTEPAPTKR